MTFTSGCAFFIIIFYYYYFLVLGICFYTSLTYNWTQLTLVIHLCVFPDFLLFILFIYFLLNPFFLLFYLFNFFFYYYLITFFFISLPKYSKKIIQIFHNLIIHIFPFFFALLLLFFGDIMPFFIYKKHKKKCLQQNGEKILE